MAKKTIQVESKVIALGEESNDMYLSLSMVFLTNEVNLNSIRFTDAFINGVADNSDKYVGSALVADISMLESGQYNKLTHKYDKNTGTFGTVGIGSFIKFYTRKTGDLLELLADARVWKRNPKTVEALEELYDSEEGLKFSYEVLVQNSSDENGVTIVDEDAGNNPIGSCVVSFPAVVSSKCELLVAELTNNSIEGGEQGNMERNKLTFTAENMFENSKINLAEIDIQQVKTKLFNQLRETMEDDYWMFDCVDIGVDYAVLKNYSTADLMKVEYSVMNNEVTIIDTYCVDKTYIKKVEPVCVCPNCDPNCPQCQECDQKEEDIMSGACKKTVAELETEIAAKDATMEKNKKDMTAKELEMEAKQKELDAKTAELAEKDTKIEVLSASVIEKDKLLTEMEPIKAEYEKILAEKAEVEIASKRVALKEKYSSLLDEATFAKVEIAEAIEKLDEVVLKDAYIEIAMASATKKTPKAEVGSRMTDSTVIGKGNDLRSKYLSSEE